MKLSRCPVCHSSIHLEALIQDESASELLNTLAKLDRPLALGLVGYIGLFRPEKSDLSNSRALRLTKEVLDLQSTGPLQTALEVTVNQIRQQRLRGETKPLANHNYLKQVIKGIAARNNSTPVGSVPTGKKPKPPTIEEVAEDKGHNRAMWERQMRGWGVDTEQYKTNKEGQ